MKWQEPRPVADWLWMDIETYENGELARVGRVSWKQDGRGVFSASITIENERGLGLYCWPDFRVLSEAQDFVEKLMVMPLDELRAMHGQQWPGVVL